MLRWIKALAIVRQRVHTFHRFVSKCRAK